MTLLLLIRHGRADAKRNRLYGTTPGIHLSDEGREQAMRVGARLSSVKLAAVYSSPFERCVETAEAIAAERDVVVKTLTELGEVEYGEWTGRTFASLRRTVLWRRVHRLPSSVRFPGGESLQEVRDRGVRALEEIAAKHRNGVVAVVTHGDVIRLVLSHYAGIHIDLFHRLVADAGSVTAVALSDGPPRILLVNDTGTLTDLVPPRPRRPRARRVRG